MTKQFDNTDRGVLFKNDRKESDKHPDYTGTINVDGVDFWLSAWLKQGKNGKFFSLSVKPKQAGTGAGNSVHAGSRENDLDDEIPF